MASYNYVLWSMVWLNLQTTQANTLPTDTPLDITPTIVSLVPVANVIACGIGCVIYAVY